MKFLRLPPWLLFILDLLKLAVIAFLIVWPIHKFVFQPFLVQGPSMEPNFFDKDYLIIEEVSYHFRQPARGEVVVFASPTEPGNYLIKRVIALPGERIVIRGGEIFIYNHQLSNGFKLKEDYLSPGLSTGGEVDQQLNTDEYYVLGDNRSVSLDSRIFGPIKKQKITGRAWLRGWPLDKLAIFEKPVYNNI